VPDARAVVRAGRAAGLPSAADRERNFEALRSRLGDGAFVDDASQLPLRASRALPTTVAMVGVGVAVAVVVGALFLGLRHRSEPNRPEPTLVNVPAMSAARVVSAATSTVPSSALSAPPAVTPPPAAAPSAPPIRRASTLALEVAILSRAASSLRAGRPAEALKAVDEHQAKFPNGLLVEERRAARAQALCALGRRSEAESDLARLSSSSPQAVRARKACATAR
jgi:hypothetical protein